MPFFILITLVLWLKFCFLVLLFNALIYRWLLGLIYFWRCFLCIFFIIVGRWVLICVNLYQSIFLTEALPYFILPMYQYYYSIPMYSIILKCKYLHTVYRYVSDIFIFLYFSSFFSTITEDLMLIICHHVIVFFHSCRLFNYVPSVFMILD